MDVGQHNTGNIKHAVYHFTSYLQCFWGEECPRSSVIGATAWKVDKDIIYQYCPLSPCPDVLMAHWAVSMWLYPFASEF